MKVTIDGIEIAAARRDPPEPTGQPLIVTLHGGLYTGRYFDVPIRPPGRSSTSRRRLGHPTVCFDRPGYGDSDALAPEENTFERHAELLGAAITEVADGAPVILVGHSIGGMIALTIAALRRRPSAARRLGDRHGRRDPVRRRCPNSSPTAAAGSGQDVIALPPEQCDPGHVRPARDVRPRHPRRRPRDLRARPGGRAHRRLHAGRPTSSPGWRRTSRVPDPQRPRRVRRAVGHVGREHRAVRRRSSPRRRPSMPA